ncbi:MAG: trehalose-6-phosphate synthase [Bacteroidetes bacterium]|nr:trehalose-6-phosphate synthase [Bacteroidota bacterium]
MKLKINFTLILSIVLAMTVVAAAFTFFQIASETASLREELKERTARIADVYSRTQLVHLLQEDSTGLKRFSDSISKDYRLLGIAVYYNKDSIITPDTSIRPLVSFSLDYIALALTADSAIGNFKKSGEKSFYQYIRPIKRTDIPNEALVFYTDASYIDRIISNIWFRNFFRWFAQVLIISFVTILVIRWGIIGPLNKIVLWLREAATGNLDKLKQRPPTNFLAPLHKEIVHIAKTVREARAIAEEEALLRSNAEAVWTPERLRIEVSNLLHEKKMVVVSNREPYMHIHAGREIKCIVPASGMITAMEPILKACGGLWIAAGMGDADRETVDKHDKILVPPEQPEYTLRRLWLTKEEEDHFYYGFSNEGLWPLCHIAHTRPVFRKEDWDYYKKVNQDFARAVIREIEAEEQPLILIQDYHFALLPELIRNERPDAKIAIFWHIPWPNAESFGICPWQRDILKGMLGADLIGFHTQFHCNNFLETVNTALESRVQWENYAVRIGDATTMVKPFPISIDFTLKDYDKPSVKTDFSRLLADYGATCKFMGIGVDRIDYTKGIIEKFLAIERFLEKYPAYVGKFTFVQVGAPSRTLLKTYADTVSAVEKEADRINWRFKNRNWKPILLLKRHHSHEEITPFYESADLCMVTSLHDGMNLVAKEFIARRGNNDGVLILSRFAGASQELKGALVVNPYDIEKMADAIKQALEMPDEEQQQRMQKMRQSLVENNIFSWAAHLLRTLTSIYR